PVQSVLLTGATDDALCINPRSRASAILGGIIVLRIDVSERRLNGVEFVAANAAGQNLLPSGGPVELPTVTFANQRNRNRKILWADDQSRFGVAVHLNLMLGIVSLDKFFAQIGVSDGIAGRSDVRAVRTKDLNQGRAIARSGRICQSIGGRFGCFVGL